MKYNKIILICTAFLTLASCTKLDENFRSETTAGGSGGGGTVNVGALLVGAYRSLEGTFMDQAQLWASAEQTTDEAVGPTRGGDWDDNGIWRVYHNHRWTSEHAFLTNTFRSLAQSQFAATTVLDNSPSPLQAAEAKFIRAFAMWHVLDGWDQVPFRPTSIGDLTKTLPETKKGTACADFLIAELNAAITNLPAGKGMGKASQDAAKALLMKIYLNKGVYANRTAPTFAVSDMTQVITLADQILAGSYSLGTNFFDNFAPTNDAIGTELIYTLKADNATGVGGNGPMFQAFSGLHYNMNPSGWNGFATLGDFYDKFDAADKRRGGSYTGLTNVTGLRVGLLFGQQFNQSGVALQDRKGNPLSFTKAVALKETGNNLEITGIRVMKYVPDLANQFPWNNDLAVFRLADVLLMKAEAIMRGGTGATNAGGYGTTALQLVNFIRTHATRGVAALGAVTLDNIFDERGRELYWENWRRNDMIRFGKFLAAKTLKPAVSGNERVVFPIPNEQLTINPNLTQNPGY